jgi:hypothetical protein
VLSIAHVCGFYAHRAEKPHTKIQLRESYHIRLAGEALQAQVG